MIKLAIVSPCYNEEEVLEDSAARLTALFDELVAKEKISADSFVLFVNDGSKDRTWSIIKKLHGTNPYIKGMNLARNVGHQYAIMAGMMTAKDWSDAVITIDADLQDDLNAIEEMIDAYTQGYDVVYGVKVSRQADPVLKRLSATAFYKLQHRMGVETIYNHADFRLMSKRSLKALVSFPERNLFLRGMVCMLGYPTASVYYDRKERIEISVHEDVELRPGRNHFFLCQTITPDYHIRAYLYAGFFPGHYLCFGGVYWRRRNPRLDFATHFCLVYRRRYPDCRR